MCASTDTASEDDSDYVCFAKARLFKACNISFVPKVEAYIVKYPFGYLGFVTNANIITYLNMNSSTYI